MPEQDPLTQQEAQHILRRHAIEIDLSDFRSPQEIVHHLGLQAVTTMAIQETPLQAPVRKEDRIERREGRTYFA